MALTAARELHWLLFAPMSGVAELGNIGVLKQKRVKTVVLVEGVEPVWGRTLDGTPLWKTKRRGW